MRMRIVGGRALVEGRLEEASIHLDSEVGIITAIGAQASAERNLDAEAEISAWLAERRIDVIAFNDHMSGTVNASNRAHKIAQMVERAGVTREHFLGVIERTKRRSDEVPASIERLAAAAVASGVPLLSHDDTSPERLRGFCARGGRRPAFPNT